MGSVWRLRVGEKKNSRIDGSLNENENKREMNDYFGHYI